jgi:hypothetical protein
MDPQRFDTLARALSTRPSRRGALLLLTTSTFGLRVWSGGERAAAHDTRKSCKKKSGKQKKSCLKKARRHDVTHTTQMPPPTGPGLAGTCTADQADYCREGVVPAANCNATTACSCFTTTAGVRFCGADQEEFCPPAGACSTDAECQAAPAAGGTQAACVMWTSPNGGGVCGSCPGAPFGSSFCVRPCQSQL